MAPGFSDRDFERAYDRCFPGFVTWAARAAGVDCDTAEDLVCQARLTAWRLCDRYDPAREGHGGPSEGFRRWAGKILVLTCRAYRRDARRQPPTVPLETIQDAPAPPACAEMSADLTAGLDTLPLHLWQVVDLHLNSYCMVEIARILGLHRNTVSNRLEEAGQRLRIALPGFEAEVDDRLISDCSEVTIYSRPSGVWDRRGTAAQVQARRRHIRVTNGFSEAPDGAAWTETPDLLQPMPTCGRSERVER